MIVYIMSYHAGFQTTQQRDAFADDVTAALVAPTTYKNDRSRIILGPNHADVGFVGYETSAARNAMADAVKATIQAHAGAILSSAVRVGEINTTEDTETVLVAY